MPEEKVIMKGAMERIGLEGSNLSMKVGDNKIEKHVMLANHSDAVNVLLESLIEENIISSLDEIEAVGHRIVHGGSLYAKSIILNDEVINEIENISDLAPLHNPANLIGVRAFMDAIPNAIQVGCFDTAFHQTMEMVDYLYPVPYEWYTKYGVRKYGFHGTSYRYICKQIPRLIGKDNYKAIICHLGSGGSIAAVKDGKSVDTSMGFAPIVGIMMGTRSGDVDPAIIPYIMEKEDRELEDVISDLNKKSGFLGLSGLSSDFRDIYQGVLDGNERCKLAFDKYVRTVVNYIGSYYLELGGVDTIIFTAGLGENAIAARLAIMEKLAPLGVKLDIEANNTRGEEVKLTTDDSKISIYAVPTNEELMIALDTLSFKE